MMETNSTLKKHLAAGWSRFLPLLILFQLLGTQLVASEFEVEVSIDPTPITCFGANDGSATANPFGGWEPYTYTWNTGDTTQTISNLAPGTYSVTVIDIDGAIGIASTVIDEPPALGSLFNITPESCPGSSDGLIEVVAFAGTPPYTYLWSNGASSATINGLPAGTYSVTVTDANGCTTENSAEVTSSPFGIATTVSSTSAGCNNGLGTATITPVNGQAPYTYLWSDGQTTATATGLAEGTYTATVTDDNGCTGENSVTVSGGSNIQLFFSASYETCPGSADGTASVNVSGGTGNLSFLWSDGQTFVVASNLSAGTYSVTVTDEEGCTATGSVEVELSPEGIWVMVNTTDADCGQNNGTAYAGVMTGVPPYTYLWSDGQTTQTAINLAPGTYSVTVTDANGCMNDIEVSGVVGQNSNLDVSATATDADCDANNGTATASVVGGTPPYTYVWSNGGDTQTITDLAPGTYSVTVTDVDGCSGEASATVETTTPDGGEISTDDPTEICVGDGADDPINVTLTGNTGPNNQWIITDDAGNILALPAGPPFNLEGAGAGVCLIWHISFEDGLMGLMVGANAADLAGCFDLSNAITVTRTEVEGGEISTNDPTTICVGDNIPDLIDVSISGNAGPNQGWIITDDALNILALPGGPPFDFDGAGLGTCLIWSISYADGITGLEVGANAADLSGCYELSNAITITRIECCEADPGTLTGPDLVCLENGSATLTATPNGDAVVPTGYQVIYVLTSGAGLIIEDADANPEFTVNAAGLYTIHTLVYDPNTLDLSIIDFGVTTGFDVNALLIQGGGDICAGLDVAGAPITVSGGPDLAIATTDVSCNGSADGSIDLTVSGEAPFSFNWSNGETTEDLTGLAAGTYSVTVTDNNGCTSTIDAEITEPVELTVDVTATNETCPGNNDGTATATPAGGTMPYSYSWSNGGTDMILTGLAPGTYDVTVTDANGCTATGSATVGTNGITMCSASVTSSYNEGVDISTFGGSDGSAEASATGGNMPYSYLWSDGQTGAEATGLSAGTYSVVITDADGCTCEAEVTLVDPAKVGNFVWNDLNENGIQDASESGINGVNVSLTGISDAGVEVNRSTTTSNNGGYIFDGLPAGEYKITFERPSGFKASNANVGANDSVDSDADPDNGMTATFNLPAATCDLTVDAGFYPCVSVGDFVWYDGNRDGIQQPWEAGFAGANVLLYNAGTNQIVDSRVTGGDGRYLFECVEPGQYYITFNISGDEYMLTIQNAGSDDELDSDPNVTTGMTANFTVVNGQPDDLSWDAGVYLICDDFNNGGAIEADQTICAGEFPDPLTSATLPSGGFGTAEYLWMSSTSGGPFDPNTWTPIPNSNSPTYAPGQLYTTTYFIRCARREGCEDYVAESNIVVIVVVPLDSPECADLLPLISTLTANMQGNNVNLEWTVTEESNLYNYYVERSADGELFHEIGMVVGQGQMYNQYTFQDENPRMGRNIYRVRKLEVATNFVGHSNEATAIMADGTHEFFSYPNPATDRTTIEQIDVLNRDVLIRVYNSTGKLMDEYQMPAAENRIEISLQRYPSGVYYVQIKRDGKDDTEVLRILKGE